MAVLAVIGLIVWQVAKPASGEAIPIMADTAHIEGDSDPEAYNSDPPTSGPHYAQEAEAGFFAVLWYPMRHRIKPLSWLGFVLLLLPMTIDGSTHMVSDFAGIGQGFRDTNAWLASSFRTRETGGCVSTFPKAATRTMCNLRLALDQHNNRQNCLPTDRQFGAPHVNSLQT